MKTHLLYALLLAFAFGLSPNLSASANARMGGEPEIKIVVGHKKIWFVADEIPLNCTSISVADSSGKVVLEKHISSKMSDWSLDISNLPTGEYSLKLGDTKPLKFSRS